jgi:hypothetical protein
MLANAINRLDPGFKASSTALAAFKPLRVSAPSANPPTRIGVEESVGSLGFTLPDRPTDSMTV